MAAPTSVKPISWMSYLDEFLDNFRRSIMADMLLAWGGVGTDGNWLVWGRERFCPPLGLHLHFG